MPSYLTSPVLHKFQISGSKQISHVLRSRKLTGTTALRCMEAASRHDDLRLIGLVAAASIELWLKDPIPLSSNATAAMVRYLSGESLTTSFTARLRIYRQGPLRTWPRGCTPTSFNTRRKA